MVGFVSWDVHCHRFQPQVQGLIWDSKEMFLYQLIAECLRLTVNSNRLGITTVALHILVFNHRIIYKFTKRTASFGS